LGATPILIPTIEIGRPPRLRPSMPRSLRSPASIWWPSQRQRVEAFRERAQLLALRPRRAASRWSALRPRARLQRSACVPSRSARITANRWPKPSCRPCCSKRPVRTSCWCWPSSARDARLGAGRRRSSRHRRRGVLQPHPRASLAALAALFADPRRYPTPSPLPAPPRPATSSPCWMPQVSRCPPQSYALHWPVTSRALADLGLPPHLEAGEPTIAALAEPLPTISCRFPTKVVLIASV